MSRRVLVALAVAVLWGAGLLVAALTVPVYSGADGATLVGENGRGALAVAVAPLLVAVLVTALLGRRRVRPRALVAAWLLVGALGLLTVAAMLSVGVYLLPLVALLVFAVACTPSTPGRGGAGREPGARPL